ncbi:MAG: 1-acyl-sn-glycerol-3-phosphate acyltransferase [Flavobacteriales bacterium]|nr:1-acyl-sn-glycerol-3-phosphate acyltransferase [Flavobacteriales bacterium]
MRWIALLALWAGFVAISLPRLRMEEDLFEALPSDPVVDRFRELLGSTAGADRVIVGFSAAEGISLDSALAAADRFVQHWSVEEGTGPIEQVENGPDPALFDVLLTHSLAHLPLLADTIALRSLAVMDSAQVDSLVGKIHEALLAPSGMALEPLLMGDPAGTLTPFFRRMRSQADLGGIRADQGVYTDRTGRTAFVLVRPAKGLSDQQRQDLVLQLRGSMRSLTPAGVKGEVFGKDAIALDNRSRIQQDARTTMAVALALILALLWWYYRKWSLPFLFLLPAAFGMLNAMAVVAWVAPGISAIALGVAATLLGIALDYSFHFFTHLRHSRNVSDTLRDIASPLLLGCLTTVLAFLSLRLLNAQLLRDLGLLAGLMLSSAALFTLVVLPHLIGQGWKEHSPAPSLEPSARWSRLSRRWSPVAVVLITLALLPFTDRVRFEQDPEKLSYMSPAVRDLRSRVFDSEADLQTVFLVTEDRDAQRAMHELETAVDALRGVVEPPFTALVAPTDALPSEPARRADLDRWTRIFPRARVVALRRSFALAAERHGFNVDAFEPFLRRLDDPMRAASAPEVDPAVRGLFEGLMVRTNEGTLRCTALARASAGQVEEIERVLGAQAGVEVLHRGALGDQLQRLIGDDLQRTLLLTSLLVFFTLLISYGRIELALITFLPMLLSWIWILGLCGLLGIPFNMVNIVVCTFVFGLGDDYCIFTSSGILARYRSGSDDGPTIRASVILSAITTIIGTGVLILAEHPALRSIAFLSVTGMLSILFISLTVQPLLYRWMITGRAAKGKFPFTLRSLLISLFAFVYFVIGCLVQLVFLPVVYILPMAKETKRGVFGRSLMIFTRSLVYVMANVRKDIVDFRAEVERTPSLVIANHSSFVDILVMLMVFPRTVMMTNRWVWNSPFFGAFVRFTGFIRSEDDVETNTTHVRELMSRGWSVVIFPEGTRSPDGRIGRFHKGAFHMAAALQAPIVPVLLHGVGYSMPKSDAMLKDGTITMRTLTSIAPGDPRFTGELKERTKAISAWFKERYTELRDAREAPSYFREQLIRNFTYKGPVLEWYIRIKSRIDARLDDRIHALLPREGRIVDLGCGYGPLAFLLHWSGPGRTILGVDHDAGKIAVATHCFGRGPQLTFAQADLTTYAPPAAEAYVLKDVLHYVPADAQRRLLGLCAARLAPGGMIIVRDGFTDDTGRHQRTRWTERFSTGLGFNKTKGALHFMGRSFIHEVAQTSGLAVDWVDEGTVTSNALVVLRKHAS